MLWEKGRSRVSGIAVALLVISFGVGLALMFALGSRIPLFTGLIIGMYLLFSIKVADQ
jgi:hypothetical protein